MHDGAPQFKSMIRKYTAEAIRRYLHFTHRICLVQLIKYWYGRNQGLKVLKQQHHCTLFYSELHTNYTTTFDECCVNVKSNTVSRSQYTQFIHTTLSCRLRMQLASESPLLYQERCWLINATNKSHIFRYCHCVIACILELQ